LHLGDLNRQQDWGSADDFMDAVLEAMNADPGTFTVATGEPFSQREFVSRAFAAADMDWLEHVKENSFDYQPTDVQLLSEQPDANLNWRHQVGFDELIQWLVDSELAVSMDNCPFVSIVTPTFPGREAYCLIGAFRLS
jgi:GDPmannose 4,6-dehydratase